MQRKHILVQSLSYIFLVISFQKLIAQGVDSTSILVKYKIVHIYDTTKPESPGEEIMQLRVANTLSEFSSYEFETEYRNYDQARYAIRQANGIMLHGSNYPENYIRKSRVIQYNYYSENKSYWVYNQIFKDYIGYPFQLPEIKWTIFNETREIGNITCQKATAWVLGRLYEAWFAPSLPFPTGPWKLHGLPGLIMEAADQKKQVQFQFVSIEDIRQLHLAIRLPVHTKITTREKYDALMETIRKNPWAMANVINPNITDEMAERFLKDNAELIAKQRLENAGKQSTRINNPIELIQ
jgi:GLPGLI family protein